MLDTRGLSLSTKSPMRPSEDEQLVTFGELAECTCKLPNTLYRRASTDPDFPEPVGVVRVVEGARRRMAFRADEIRDWIAKEVALRQFDPAVLERFDRLVAQSGS